MKTRSLIFLALALGLGDSLAQPVITRQPQSWTNLVGTTATFSVIATGAPPLSYQWTVNTTANRLPGATNDTLTIANVQTNHVGIYRVIVTDPAGSVQSASARLALADISQQPSNQSVSLGANPNFLFVVTNMPPPVRYQWQLAGTNLVNETNASLNLTNIQFADVGNYQAVATASFGSLTSRLAHLELDPTFTKITTGSIVNDNGSGFACAWGDYDNDGWVDLFVANYQPVNMLYHNNGNGTLTRVTEGPIVTATGSAIGAAWGDYNNDGLLDLFIANGQGDPNTLYRNEGNGKFSKIRTGLLVTEPLYSHMGVWADFNNDGWLDLFVVNDDEGQPNYHYRNKGDGSFDRLSFGTKSSGGGFSWNVAAADFNNDGWLDLFIAQGGSYVGRQRSLLYANRRDGTFTWMTNSAVSANSANSVSCAWADYDNDGFLDLFVANFYAQNNSLYHNNRDGTFTSVTNSPVTLDGGWSVGCAWADYDNDGWLDLFVSNLGPIDPDTRVSIAPERNLLYHNNGDGTFTKIASGSLVNDLGYSTGCAWGDYDNDGFLDLFVVNGWKIGKKDFLYRNNGNSNNWINFGLIGTASNRSAIGAKVRVKATIGGNVSWQLRELSGGSNFGSQNDMRANFGLGDATNVDTVRIEWPSGTVQELHNVAAKQFLILTEPPRLLVDQTNGTEHLAIRGGRGLSYQIETSTNLPDWSPLGTVTITNQNAAAPILDTNTPGPRRFYRAVAR